MRRLLGMFLRWSLFIYIRDKQSLAYALSTIVTVLQPRPQNFDPGMWSGKGNSIKYDWQNPWPSALALLTLIQELVLPAALRKAVRSFGKPFFSFLLTIII